MVSGGHLDLRLERSSAPKRDWLLRSRPDALHEAGERGLLVGVLVQRPHVQLRDRAWPGHLRPRAERLRLAERDRRRKVGALRLPECAGPTEAGVAGELLHPAFLFGPAGAVERTSRYADQRGEG